MLVLDAPIAAKDYALIGKLHARQNPDEARQLIEGYRQEQSRALDSDLHNLNFYFLNYCKLKGYLATDYIGAIKKREKTEARKLFIASMIRIFHPQLFTYDVNTKSGLSESMCIVLRLDSGEMSKILEEVTAYYNHNWQDFSQRVNQLSMRLISLKDGYPCTLFEEEAA
jgi:hypothetical protein